MRSVCKGFAGVVGLVACAGAAQGQMTYTAQLLPPLVPGESVHVDVVTNTGIAAGSAWDGNATVAVRWLNGVPTPIPGGPPKAQHYRVTAHSGDTLALAVRVNDHDQPFRWDPVGGFQPIMGGGEDNLASGINSSGAVCGQIALRAVHWTSSGGAAVIQFPNTPAVPDYGGATAINDNGVVVGYAGHAAGPIPVDGLQAFRWTQATGIERLEINLGGSYAFAYDVNAAGDIVGSGATVDFPELGPEKAFLWRNGVVTVLGDLNNPKENNLTVAINDAGEVLGYDGWPVSIGPPPVLAHWVWVNGEKIFLDHVTSGIPEGFRIQSVSDMNNAGTVAAMLFNESTFEWHAALLVRDTGCYPDCNGTGGLTIADFGCFQTRFVAGDPYADCNGVGGLTIADFACFQTQFVAGCP